MDESRKKLIASIEEGMSFEIQEIKAHLSGDGSLWGRMNACEGGQEMTPFVKKCIAFCEKKGITKDQIDAEFLADYLIETARTKDAK